MEERGQHGEERLTWKRSSLGKTQVPNLPSLAGGQAQSHVT